MRRACYMRDAWSTTTPEGSLGRGASRPKLERGDVRGPHPSHGWGGACGGGRPRSQSLVLTAGLAAPDLVHPRPQLIRHGRCRSPRCRPRPEPIGSRQHVPLCQGIEIRGTCDAAPVSSCRRHSTSRRGRERPLLAARPAWIGARWVLGDTRNPNGAVSSDQSTGEAAGGADDAGQSNGTGRGWRQQGVSRSTSLAADCLAARDRTAKLDLPTRSRRSSRAQRVSSRSARL